MSKKKIALFGGTFDPIHLGHTTVVQTAAKHLRAEQVIFIPAKRSALKSHPPQASDEDRLEMITLAIAGYENFSVSDCELQNQAPSFTLETVRFLQDQFGRETLLYWLVGADTVTELPRWYRIAELIEECNLSVIYRAGCKKPDFTKFTDIFGSRRVKKLQQNIIPAPMVNISSTKIRNGLAAGCDVANMLHPKVAEYIREHGLYKSKHPQKES